MKFDKFIHCHILQVHDIQGAGMRRKGRVPVGPRHQHLRHEQGHQEQCVRARRRGRDTRTHQRNLSRPDPGQLSERMAGFFICLYF